MAVGALERTPADIAVAITCVAGPEPDEDGNPVGLSFIAWAHRDERVLVDELHLKGTKDEICCQAMAVALGLCAGLLA